MVSGDHSEFSLFFLPFFVVPEDCKETIFEGVQFLDNSSFVDAHYDRVQEVARQQMKHIQASQKDKWKAYQARYGPQVDEIIQGYTQYDRNLTATEEARRSKGKKTTRSSAGPVPQMGSAENDTPPQVLKHVPGMFSGNAGIAANWKTGYTSLINGTGYQHPHADAGRPDSYKGLQIFPFVTLHGFGVDEFSVWLFPDPYSNTSKCGFLHTFKAHQMLFMRGDFVHAGVPSNVPRGHMKFFPSAEAGWKRSSSYWNRKGWENVTFMWQGAHPPFGFPCVGSPDLSGLHVVTYPVAYTKLLRYPYTAQECELLGIVYEPLSDAEKKERTALKRKVVAQLAHGVYNT